MSLWWLLIWVFAVAGWLLSAAGPGAGGVANAPASEPDDPAPALYGAHCAPELITVFSADGEIVGSWHGLSEDPVAWASPPDRFHFYAETTQGFAGVEADPASGRLSRDDLVMRRERGVIELTDASAGAESGPSPRLRWHQLSDWRLAADGLWFGDRLMLEDRELDLELRISPTGRWIALVRHQPWASTGVYTVSPDGSSLTFHGLEDRTGPREWRRRSVVSPDGRWVAVESGERLPLPSSARDAQVIEVPGSWVVWAPDSSGFAFLALNESGIEPGIAIADLDGNMRTLIGRCQFVFTQEWSAAGITYTQSFGIE